MADGWEGSLHLQVLLWVAIKIVEHKLSAIISEVSSRQVTIRLHEFSIPALSFVTIVVLPYVIL